MSNDPLKIMDEIERNGWTAEGGAFVSPREWYSLRTALERQAEGCAGMTQTIDQMLEAIDKRDEDLAQKDARIARLEENCPCTLRERESGHRIGCPVPESESQSAAHLKAEALREAAKDAESPNHLWNSADYAVFLRRRADAIEREAKESGHER